jgi:hypothetical protein
VRFRPPGIYHGSSRGNGTGKRRHAHRCRRVVRVRTAAGQPNAPAPLKQYIVADRLFSCHLIPRIKYSAAGNARRRRRGADGDGRRPSRRGGTPVASPSPRRAASAADPNPGAESAPKYPFFTRKAAPRPCPPAARLAPHRYIHHLPARARIPQRPATTRWPRGPRRAAPRVTWARARAWPRSGQRRRPEASGLAAAAWPRNRLPPPWTARFRSAPVGSRTPHVVSAPVSHTPFVARRGEPGASRLPEPRARV